jgi:hypothetical protein
MSRPLSTLTPRSPESAVPVQPSHDPEFDKRKKPQERAIYILQNGHDTSCDPSKPFPFMIIRKCAYFPSSAHRVTPMESISFGNAPSKPFRIYLFHKQGGGAHSLIFPAPSNPIATLPLGLVAQPILAVRIRPLRR